MVPKPAAHMLPEPAPGMPAVDLSRPFMPEPLTPLFHAPGYRRLGPAPRLRYNQLHAMYVNEQILFFEDALAENILGALLREPIPARLAAGLFRFREDEARHSAMFRELNRRCAPEAYATADFRFVRVGPAGRRALQWVGSRPRRFPLLVWLMLMLEERALHFARETLRHARRLEPHFVMTHRRHLRDEAHHVQWDQDILDWLWPRTRLAVRRLNAGLFGWLVGEFFNVPRRGAVAVLRQLARECPEVAAEVPALTRELRGLAGEERFHLTLYSREIVPRTFRRFDACPEFAAMGRVLRGYRPAGPGAPCMPAPAPGARGAEPGARG